MESELKALCTATTTGLCTVFGGTRAAGNVRLAATCDDAACFARSACASTDDCDTAVFPQMDVGSQGRKDILSGTTWRLGPGNPCAVVRSSLDLHKIVNIDIDAIGRSATPSMGASEDSDCVP
jgi:hypothetical protein